MGVDAFTDAYAPPLKKQNLRSAVADSRFQLVVGNLLDLTLPEVLADCEVIFHLAGQTGVRGGWGPDAQLYFERNVLATQRLLKAAQRVSLRKFVFASSSSVYGQVALPARESDPCQPLSPYAVTKLAAERLAMASWRKYGLPVVALRYFAVYGPRQRPDMAFSRFIAALRGGSPLPIYGDGSQSRDFTYVADVVQATVRAAERPVEGECINVGSGVATRVLDVVAGLEALVGRRAQITWLPQPPGEPHHTEADITKARNLLGYCPRVRLARGACQSTSVCNRRLAIRSSVPGWCD